MLHPAVFGRNCPAGRIAASARAFRMPCALPHPAWPGALPAAEEALADPYFAGLSQPSREPSAQPISKLAFEFERRKLVVEEVRAGQGGGRAGAVHVRPTGPGAWELCVHLHALSGLPAGPPSVGPGCRPPTRGPRPITAAWLPGCTPP